MSTSNLVNVNASAYASAARRGQQAEMNVAHQVALNELRSTGVLLPGAHSTEPDYYGGVALGELQKALPLTNAVVEVQEKLVKLEAKLDGLSLLLQQLQEIHTHVKSLDSRMARVEATLASMHTRLNNLMNGEFKTHLAASQGVILHLLNEKYVTREEMQEANLATRVACSQLLEDQARCHASELDALELRLGATIMAQGQFFVQQIQKLSSTQAHGDVAAADTGTTATHSV